MKLSLSAKRTFASKVNTMVYTNLRPAVCVSKTGKPGSYICCEKPYKVKDELNSQTDIPEQTQVVLKDVEECIEYNPTKFIGIIGWDEYNYVNTFYLIHKPDLP